MMPCEILNVGNGNLAIVCSRRRHDKCKFCGAICTKLCDFPVGNQKTCDAKMCDACATNVGPALDYCPRHAAQRRLL